MVLSRKPIFFNKDHGIRDKYSRFKKYTHCTNFLIVQILCLLPPQRRGNFEYVILVLKNNTTVTARGHHMKWIQWIVISYTAFWPVSVQAWKLLLIVFKLKKKLFIFISSVLCQEPWFHLIYFPWFLSKVLLPLSILTLFSFVIYISSFQQITYG